MKKSIEIENSFASFYANVITKAYSNAIINQDTADIAFLLKKQKETSLSRDTLTLNGTIFHNLATRIRNLAFSYV